MSDIAFKVIIKNDGIDDVIFKTLMLKGEKGDKGDAGGAEIDDTSTAYSTTWSSNKINDEISSMPDNLSELDDVALANITDGQVLAYDIANHRWKNNTADASSLNYEAGTSIKDKIDEKANTADLSEVATGGQLIDLSDVDVSSPSANDALVWDAEHGKWIAGSVSTVGSIDDLTDVDTANASAGDCLRYDASNSEWISQKQVIELTQAEYDALQSKQPKTLYVITDAPNVNATAQDISYEGSTDTVWDKVEGKAEIDNTTVENTKTWSSSKLMSEFRTATTGTISAGTNCTIRVGHLYKRNNVVYCDFAINVTDAISTRTKIGNLPEGFRPSGGTTLMFIVSGSTGINGVQNRATPLLVTTGGDLIVGDVILPSGTIKEVCGSISFIV